MANILVMHSTLGLQWSKISSLSKNRKIGRNWNLDQASRITKLSGGDKDSLQSPVPDRIPTGHGGARRSCMISVRMRRPTGNIRSAHLDPPFFGIDDAHRAADCRGHTQTSDPSGLNCANRGRVSTNTLEVISWVSVSMKWAMLVVSDVATTVLPSGLTPMPSGSTPTGDLGDRGLGAKIDYRDQIVVLVCDVESLAVGAEDKQIRIRAYQPTTL